MPIVSNVQDFTTNTTKEFDLLKNIYPVITLAYLYNNNLIKATEFCNKFEVNSTRNAILKIIIEILNGNYDIATDILKSTKSRFMSVVLLNSDSYNQLFRSLAPIINLAESQEMIEYKRYIQKSETDMSITNEMINEKKIKLSKIWSRRFEEYCSSPEMHYLMLIFRSNILKVEENYEDWINFVNHCLKENHTTLAGRALDYLSGDSKNIRKLHPKISYTRCKYDYHIGNKVQACLGLEDLIKSIDIEQYKDVKIMCYLCYVQWNLPTLTQENIKKLLEYSLEATYLDRSNRKAFHQLGLLYYNCLDQYQYVIKGNTNMYLSIPELASKAIVSICETLHLSTHTDDASSIQDILKLISLWFKYGEQSSVYEILKSNIDTVSLDLWLKVIPQLTARMCVEGKLVSSILTSLLEHIVDEYPQAIFYPLSVYLSSNTQTQQEKRTIFDSLTLRMKSRHTLLYQQAIYVVKELIKVAITINEYFITYVERGLRAGYKGDYPSFIENIETFYTVYSSLPDRQIENDFYNMYNEELQDIYKQFSYFKVRLQINEYEVISGRLSILLKDIKEKTYSINQYELRSLSPYLYDAKDLLLLIPLTFCEIKEEIYIKKFCPTVYVIHSKEKPRKIQLKGSNGKIYTFMLKGNEDLRQDERIMQAFGLLNVILKTKRETADNSLSIHRYSCTPLSCTVGIVEWLSNHDTLHSLICHYRMKHNIKINIEHIELLTLCPEYNSSTLIQQIEAFETAMKVTNGMELANILWLQSENSDIWCEKRSLYVRSLAVMSVIGYLIGIGDRHLSNLMINRSTGKICHIDFGDCFETAMHREKFPERVPFRLTRLLINAMELCSVEGTFRYTCERVMNVIRTNHNRESLLALLEAFIYDPLINWRLVKKPHYNEFEDEDDEGVREDGKEGDENRKNNFFGENDGIIFSDSEESSNTTNSSSRRLSVSYTNYDLDDGISCSPHLVDKVAVKVLKRIKDKLTGLDISPVQKDVKNQISCLIDQATSSSNLCQAFIGWYPFW